MQTGIRNILRNSTYLLLMNLSQLAALFTFSVLLVRAYGTETLGLYTLFNSALLPFIFFVDLGQSTSLVQEIGRHPERGPAIVRNTILIKLVFSGIAALLFVAGSLFFFESDAQRQLFWLFGLLLLPRAIYVTLEAAVRAHQKMKYLMYLAGISGFLLVGGSWLLLQVGISFAVIIIFLLVVEVCRTLVLWGVYRRKLVTASPDSAGIDLSFSLGLIKRTLPFFVVGLAGLLHYRLDILLLARLTDATEVGIFSAANNFVKVMRLAPSVVVSAFFPAISGISDLKQIKKVSFRTLGIQVLAAATLASFVFLLSDWLIMSTYHIEASVKVLRIFVWTLIPLSVYSTLIYVFHQTDRTGWALNILSVAVIMNVSLNYFLIPIYGATALAVSMLASESFCLAAALFLFVYYFRRSRFREYRERVKWVSNRTGITS